jgi:two-component system, OmpR family, osmolarity sensor histidine kinase EnvZ
MAESKTLYDRFNTLLEAYAPEDLYRRALAIMITPVVLLQLLLAGVLVSRYLDNVANVLARTLADETALIVALYENSDKSEAAIETVKVYARDKLHMELDVQTDGTLPEAIPASLVSVFDKRFNAFLAQDIKQPFRVNSFAGRENVEIRVAVDAHKLFLFRVDTNRAQAVGTPLLLLFMALSTLLFMGIAVVFMRNQIKPILDLTAAAQQFGKGREISSFRPEGATEVRLAGEAFLDMKRRIARHVEQRTTLLAGVSHDLRTILTRFKLELAVLGGSAKTKPLHDDVNEMQHMLEDYMAFVRGDGGEQTSDVGVIELVTSVSDSLDRSRQKTVIRGLPDMKIQLKANAFRRLLSNVVVNALRFGKRVEISGEQRDQRLWLYVDDDGPGIPEHLRDDVFKPFTRLDEARNLDHSGSGLGLAIALDIAHAHGGDIVLEDSKLGGLRVAVKVPI